MKRIALGLLLAPLFAYAQGALPQAPKPSALPKLLAEVEARYVKAATLTADFAQVDHLAALNQDKKSSGLLEVRRPDKFRWQTKKPDANLLVTDGRTFWFYTPPFDTDDPTEHGQVIVHKKSQVQSRLATALLSGSFSTLGAELKIKSEGKGRFDLIPRKGAAGDVRRAQITIDPARKVIEKVTLVHADGNRAEITLSNIQLGAPLKSTRFQFVIPPNTDRVKE